jgi:hypothetical protein
MATGGFNWDSAWANTSVNASAIANGANLTTSAAISNDNKAATEVGVTVTYGATATQGVVVELLRDVDGTNFEASTDGPFGFSMLFSTSTAYRRTFTVLGENVSAFKVKITNNSGASVTATIQTKQATFDSA